ncbi:(E3-independent) E2 ubiquitin-conjugating enzyme [Thalictrum thalictroides]|uniref:E2 ubiquitin-conjugating enzyme n=1 Tax=Thalictrum thalictroides TaxID=46969 RepID=A0A7J6WSW1_THATH|nr:(E3-independent) E2 ubiquitin-conjugating enzyme [Thalictrum thalictroides]
MASDVSQDLGSNQLKQDQDVFSEDPIIPTTTTPANFGSNIDVPMSPVNSSANGSECCDDIGDYNSDSSNYSDGMAYDDDYSYDDEKKMQALIDKVDLPAGVEVSLPWLEQPSSSQNPSATSSSSVPSQKNSNGNTKKKEEDEACLQDSFKTQTNHAGTSTSIALSQSTSCRGEEKPTSTSSSTVSGLLGSRSETEEKGGADVVEKMRLFKQFDTVQGYSDHHFIHGASISKQAPLKWSKTIQQEWKILEKGLPDTIYVRVYEERMDLLRAVILGTPGTPYHDGLFFFDVFFPSDYPDVPPQVYYHSGGLRLNPNLYDDGKVCLSLLNTWPGQADENWTPGKSTMLQVLLSIQALVLNEKPYFNEPGFEESAGKKEGEVSAQDYNETTFILSCKTMLYTLRRPPKHYEDLVAGHFFLRAHTILEACKAYMEGVKVGCYSGSMQDMDEQAAGCSRKLQREISDILPRMVNALSRNGALDCEQFLPIPN